MKRSHVLLAALAVVLVLALFWVLLFQPARDDLAEVEAQIALQETEQTQLDQDIAQLRAVREEAPQVEAELAAAEAIVPPDAALPAALRQLQVAADESGAILEAVTAGRPVPLEVAMPAPTSDEPEEGTSSDEADETSSDEADEADETPPDEPAPLPEPDVLLTEGLSSIEVSVQLVGSYFQIVDFLRRVEQPQISPRGLTWSDATFARGEEYPALTVSMTGQLYALIAVPPPPEAETPAGPANVEIDEDADAQPDGDVEENDAADAPDDEGATGTDADTEDDS